MTYHPKPYSEHAQAFSYPPSSISKQTILFVYFPNGERSEKCQC